MEQFSDYSHAIMSLALFSIVVLILNPIAAIRKSSDGVVSGAMPAPDYANPNYRLSRTYLNATEIAGLFCSVTVAAILAGANPFWVNLLASLFFVSRLIMIFVHVRGIGKADGGPRTMVFTFGWACCLILGVMAVVAVF